MSSLSGGKKAHQTITRKYGKDFMKVIGKRGGSVRHPETRMFNVDRGLARRAGHAGGKKTKQEYHK